MPVPSALVQTHVHTCAYTRAYAHVHIHTLFYYIRVHPQTAADMTPARLDTAVRAGALAVITLDESQRAAFALDCPPLEPGERICPAEFARRARELVERTLPCRALQLLRWFIGVADRPDSFDARMPTAILFRNLRGQADGCCTPNCPPALPADAKQGAVGRVAGKRDSISEAWMVGIRELRVLAAHDRVEQRLPANLVPVLGCEQVLGNEGSARYLGWHCDGGFDRDGLIETQLDDYLMLYGLRGIRGVPTLCCDSIMAVDGLARARIFFHRHFGGRRR